MNSIQWERDYWNQRYSNGHGSGAGSQGPMMQRKVDILSNLPDLHVVTEIGCGDFNFGRHLMDQIPKASYDGYDIAPAILDRNRESYELPRIRFHDMDYRLDWCDLLICVDVLFHIIEDEEYQRMLDTINKTKWKYLAITAYEYDGPSDRHVRIRKFDPSVFGEPIVKEVIEEDGTLYLYVFKRD